jgi:hypothetical protein
MGISLIGGLVTRQIHPCFLKHAFIVLQSPLRLGKQRLVGPGTDIDEGIALVPICPSRNARQITWPVIWLYKVTV